MRRAPSIVLLLATCSSTAPMAAAQVVNPAQAQQQPSKPPPEDVGRLRSWELPATVVTGERVSPLREEDLVGDYGQPRWSTRRLFASTRIYVIPPGKFGLEYWTRVKAPKEGQTTVETQYEIEFGLPGRFQLDLYAVKEKTGSEGELDVSEQKYELRYALADWGKIWGNPTLYFEYVSVSEADDAIEAKILLGDQLDVGWHWGSNLVFEHGLGGERENEYELTLGLARTIVDEKFSVGAEVKAALTDVRDDRGDYEESLEIGPSMRWCPVPAMHIDFAPLVGIGSDSRKADVFVVLGWEF